MKKFLIRTAGIVCGACFLFLLLNIAYYVMTKDSRQVAFEVYDAADKAGVNDGYTGLVLGDSVARQIFQPKYQEESDDICYLATNQAVTTIGNFVLMERFLENNPQIEDVYYIARPDSIMGNPNFIYTYSYFVTPLYNELFLQYLEPETKAELENVYGRFFVSREFPKWMLAKYPKLLDIYQNGRRRIQQMKRKADGGEEMDMAAIYLGKMKAVCDEKNIRFHLLAPPIPENYEYFLEEMQDRLYFEGEEELLNRYMDSIIYVSEDELVDGVHMSDSYLEKNRESIRERLLEQ
ncbi:MAG: hypothetical protein NC321_08135 [Clostridium sp.]|nr:hypothetical protein [Clostridium sp.]